MRQHSNPKSGSTLEECCQISCLRLLFVNIYAFIGECAHVCARELMHMHVSVCPPACSTSWDPKKPLDLLELKLHSVMRQVMWILGSKSCRPLEEQQVVLNTYRSPQPHVPQLLQLPPAHGILTFSTFCVLVNDLWVYLPGVSLFLLTMKLGKNESMGAISSILELSSPWEAAKLCPREVGLYR